MAIPRVFISSTCIDLKYIRSSLKSMVESMGYEPILSEYGKVFFNPEEHTHDSCLNEIENCQLFILIIGGRYGGKYKETDKSITFKEYEKAYKKNIPIFTLVDDEVYKEHHLYLLNKQNPNTDINKIIFSSVDSTAIFDFIDIVRKQSKNNAIQPFNDFSDIENYIKKQFAGLFFSCLSKTIEKGRKSKNIGLVLNDNNKTEFLPSQLFKITGSDKIEVLDKKNKKYSHEQKYFLSKIFDSKEKKQESALLINLIETNFYSDTWINPLADLCLSFLEFLQKKPGGQYVYFKEALIGTEKKPGEIIKEYYRNANLLKEEYLDHHKIAALYIRSFLKYHPFYIDVPDDIKKPELCLYTLLSNEYFSIVLLDTIFKAFNDNFNKGLRIDDRYETNFIKLLYQYKKDIDKLNPLALANIIYLIEQSYFM